VKANVLQGTYPLSTVTLFYTVDGGEEQIKAAVDEGEGIWVASFGQHPGGTEIPWRLVAIDEQDNEALWPQDGGWLSFKVIEPGPIVAWGENWFGQCSVPSPNTGFVAIAAGSEHSLGLKSDGTIIAWGNNDYGQSDVPEPNSDFISLSAGRYHSLGLKSDGTIVAWGAGQAGLSGFPHYGQCNVPVPNADFIAVSGGQYHSLGLKTDGSIVAWGGNAWGQSNVPVPNAGFVAVAAGAHHSLGLKSDGTIVAWGLNMYGECDVPDPNDDFVSVAIGTYFSLGLKSDGTVVAWGSNANGECDVPLPNADFVAIAAASSFGLGLKSDGTIVAWGNCTSGQCDVPLPNENYLAVSAGWYHSLALKYPEPLYSVTLNLDMSYTTGFDPETDLVYVTGTFAGFWPIPGTDPDNQLMTRVGETMIWTKTFLLEEGDYEYKYFLNDGWDGGEWAWEPNREITVAGDMVVNDLWGYLEFPDVIDVPTLAGLRAMPPGEMIFRYTGEAVIVAMPGQSVVVPYIYSDFEENSNVTFAGWPNSPTVVANPYPSGINTSTHVAQWQRSADPIAHAYALLDGKLDFSQQQIFRFKIWSPIACEVRFKVEDKTDHTIAFEVSQNVSDTEQWVELTYDFSGAESGMYDKIVIFMDFLSSADNIFYFDHVTGPPYEGAVKTGSYTFNSGIKDRGPNRNRKFIQDETAAIFIFDAPGNITTSYNLYDVMTNVTGQIEVLNNMVRFLPTQNAPEALGNTPVEPYEYTLTEVTPGDQAKLIKFINVTFQGIEAGEVFDVGQNYTLTDGTNTFVLRTMFWDEDYIGMEIPHGAVNITGVVTQFHDDMQITPRFAADIEVQPEGITLNIKVILEGAFSPGDATLMRTTLNADVPLSQPYAPGLPYFGNNNPKWYYAGDESVDVMPANAVDWVLVELRDAAAANQATVALAKQAALLLNTGHIVGIDGQPLVFDVEIEQGLYVVVYHRNHLAVMSSQALTEVGGVYTWDFTLALDKAYVREERAAYQNGQKPLPGGGFFGMYGGDGDGDGQVLLQDLLNVLNPQSGQSGYRAGDFDLDGQVLLQDLLNILNPNSGLGTQVP
ncbi:MAG: hypothetical protein EA393_05025, partial [Bacteroidetes bacterium]